MSRLILALDCLEMLKYYAKQMIRSKKTFRTTNLLNRDFRFRESLLWSFRVLVFWYVCYLLSSSLHQIYCLCKKFACYSSKKSYQSCLTFMWFVVSHSNRFLINIICPLCISALSLLPSISIESSQCSLFC